MGCDRPTVALLLQKLRGGGMWGGRGKKPASWTVQQNKGYECEAVEESPRQGWKPCWNDEVKNLDKHFFLSTVLKLSVCLPLQFSSLVSSFSLSLLFWMTNIRIDQFFFIFFFHFLSLFPIPHHLIPVFFLHMMEHTSVSKHLFCVASSISCLLFHPFRPFPPDDKDQTNQLKSSGKDRDVFEAETDTVTIER